MPALSDESDNNQQSQVLAPSQRRLQRPADFTGQRLNTFRQLFLRHGLPVAILAALCLLLPEVRTLLATSLSAMLAAPASYGTIGALIFVALLAYAYHLDRQLDPQAMGWILYLLAVSIWEELFFRLVVPYLGLNYAEILGIGFPILVIGSNMAFGAMHYFTLRWKWPWCLLAFLGGLGLSRNFEQNFDLALIIAIHWVATFVNTPRLPGRRGSAAGTGP